ncbi:MAG: extracellular solute-binding protein [Zhenhengia sp.]|jgi:sn-glycerol 3-phosphate transport system substrate-binding protein|uniref:extracellular solute-binding protein n=1 Tax=Zhenhengia sp. TaxID=2944208 RepID=UPI002913BCE4|nr:extracellular solute-binding protein [Clostridiales bacterium]MDU6973069.1 extracellular solute-binding protein [Clostridiales bacterium]
MKLKKLIAMGLATTMLLATTACANGEANETPTPDAAPNGATQITYWHSMDGIFGEIVNKQVEAFNSTIGQEKNIVVTPVFQNWPGTEALTAAMSTDDVKNMPDVIQLYGESVSLIRDYKRTVWAEDYITSADSTVKKEDLIPNTISSHSIEGKMIGVPYTSSALMMYYNKTYFDQAGITDVPTTIAQMAEIMPTLVEKTDAEYGLNVRVDQFELENWIATQGTEGSYFGNNESGHNGHMTELEADKNGTLMNFLTEWEKVVGSGAYKATRDSINEEFAAGMHAMVIMTSSRIQTIADLVGDKFEWGIAPIPTVSGEDVGGAYPSGSGLYMLDRDDEAKKAAAWEFVQFMISPEAQVMWLDGTGYVPVNTKTVELDAYKAAIEKEPRLNAPLETLQNTPATVVPAFCPNSSTVGSVIKDAMMAFGTGAANKDQTYTAIVDGITQAMNDYYRANPINE